MRKKKLFIIILSCALLWLLISSFSSKSKADDFEEYQNIGEFNAGFKPARSVTMIQRHLIDDGFQQAIEKAKQKDKIRQKYLKENDYNEAMYDDDDRIDNKRYPKKPNFSISSTVKIPIIKDGNAFGNRIRMDGKKLGPTGINSIIGAKREDKEAPISNNKNGENGEPVPFDAAKLSKQKTLIYKDLLKKFGHNEYISQKVSVHRRLPDYRAPICQSISYNSHIYKEATVVISFFNEAWSTLMRTVHSILDRSPTHLIKEIILVDDYSDMDHLKQPLDDYIRLVGKIRVIRTRYRMGVIQARQLGAIDSTAPYIIFLDSHCECTEGWLEPLLSRLSEDENVVVTPIMDIINDATFAYKSFELNSINIGGFDWNLQFIWIGVPERIKKIRKTDSDPISTPTMAGGMFAISKNLFFKLGGYDSDMTMWGAENLEMSFRIWTCGAKLEVIPCSHVGHVFKRGMSYKLANSDNKLKNFYRLAEVWLDDYKKFYYQKIGDNNLNLENIGDISGRVLLRKNLQCKSFAWYIENIYPEIFIPTEAVETGELRNRELVHSDGTTFKGCIDAGIGSQSQQVAIWPCHGQGGNQLWMMSKTGELRRDEMCLDYSGSKIILMACHGQKGNQEWIYTAEKQLVHKASGLCISLLKNLNQITMTTCSSLSSHQVWYWIQKRKKYRLRLCVDPTALRSWIVH